MVAHAAAVVARTDVAAQEDTMALVVSTGMPAYPIRAKIVAHAAALVAHTDVTAQQDTQAPVVNTELEIFKSLHEVDIISQIRIHGVIAVIPTFKLRQWIIGETVLQNVLTMMVVIRAQNGMNR